MQNYNDYMECKVSPDGTVKKNFVYLKKLGVDEDK